MRGLSCPVLLNVKKNRFGTNELIKTVCWYFVNLWLAGIFTDGFTVGRHQILAWGCWLLLRLKLAEASAADLSPQLYQAAQCAVCVNQETVKRSLNYKVCEMLKMKDFVLQFHFIFFYPRAWAIVRLVVWSHSISITPVLFLCQNIQLSLNFERRNQWFPMPVPKRDQICTDQKFPEVFRSFQKFLRNPALVKSQGACTGSVCQSVCSDQFIFWKASLYIFNFAAHQSDFCPFGNGLDKDGSSSGLLSLHSLP